MPPKWADESAQITIFHQARFPWNKGSHFEKATFWGAQIESNCHLLLINTSSWKKVAHRITRPACWKNSDPELKRAATLGWREQGRFSCPRQEPLNGCVKNTSPPAATALLPGWCLNPMEAVTCAFVPWEPWKAWWLHDRSLVSLS